MNRHPNRAGHSAFGHLSTTISRIALTGQTAATSPVPRVNRTAPIDSEQAASVNRTCTMPGLRMKSFRRAAPCCSALTGLSNTEDVMLPGLLNRFLEDLIHYRLYDILLWLRTHNR